MTQVPILVPASKLSKSPTNVRRSSDTAADQQLKANIAERGILQNLIGVPVARKKGEFRITAGGRRLDCVHALIDEGSLPPDFLVPVLPLANARDAIEISLSENFFRLAMTPADACRAFQDIMETEGKTVADVARRFGLTERFVLGRMRLASLAEPIFEALSDGTLSLDVASAYAATSDKERQAAIFAEISGTYYHNNVSEIRRRLASYSYRANDPRALLVGREAYIEAGGRVDADLFSDAETEIWLDTHIVDEMVGATLHNAAAALRERDRFADVRIIPATHLPYAETYGLEPLAGDRPTLSELEEARKIEVEEAIFAIEQRADNEELCLEEEQQLQSLEGELRMLVDRTPMLTDEQRAQAVAYIIIGHDGAPRLHDQLYRAPAGHGSEDCEAEELGEAPTEMPPSDENRITISQRLRDELAMMKTELLAVHVAADPGFASNLGTFIMAEAATHSFAMPLLPSDLRANAPSPRASGFVSETAAANRWTALEEGLDRSWIDHDFIVARYDAFCLLPAEARAAWLGWSVARTLHAVPAGKPGCAMLDHLGCKLAIDVATSWRPTARNYFDRVTKPGILDIFTDIGGSELRSRYASSKKHELAMTAEHLFAGELIVEADLKTAALRWIPPEMAFGPAAPAVPVTLARQTDNPSASSDLPDTDFRAGRLSGASRVAGTAARDAHA
jgi:ParB family chromosome partitioning protein